ncbi:wax ester/triacylglycerol synthase family O-acyltransferase [Mycolicibacterium sp. ND9-15]|uniref:WS/DGAT/MGAT family O-acyltransferase n=1 Tax=Mycolicibacterium sp. ND9-15 TaxID=3042320 RepID=UPI002DDBAA19|nr:wax ester/triacylglycerol synthase family O-acyltransferase [Mycolicibacterium sp. ND9-15]WSE55127.1 wax ester/triacylglycerol synthase family O-acyltransferase [Mycolicibacterium sp. ND9-15]
MERLSGFDASFLYVESSDTPMHVCSLLELDTSTMPGGYTFDRLREALLQRIDALPEFREKVVDTVLNPDHPAWAEDDRFDIDRHLHRVAVPVPGGPREVAELCGQLASAPLDRGLPLWQMWVIEGLDGTDPRRGGRVAVLSKIHHAVIDGVSSAGLMSRLCSLAPDSQVPEPLSGAGEVSTLRLALGGAVNVATRPLQLAGLLSRTVWTAVDILRRMRAGRTMAAPFAAPATPFNAAVSGRRAVGFAELDLADVKSIAKRFTVTVNDVVLTLCSEVLRQYLIERDALPSASLIAAVPVSVHDRVRESGRNQTSVLFTRLETQLADPGERLRAVALDDSTAKEHSSSMDATLVMDWTRLMNHLVAAPMMYLYAHSPLSERPIHNLVISNVRGPTAPLYFLGSAITAMYPLGPIFHGAGLNITVLSHDTKLDVGIITCPDLVPDVWAMADGFSLALKHLLDAEPSAPS